MKWGLISASSFASAGFAAGGGGTGSAVTVTPYD